MAVRGWGSVRREIVEGFIREGWSLGREYYGVLRSLAAACRAAADAGWKVEDMMEFLELEEYWTAELSDVAGTSLQLQAWKAVRGRTYAQVMVKVMLAPLFGRFVGQTIGLCFAAGGLLQCIDRKGFVHCGKPHQGHCVDMAGAVRAYGWDADQRADYQMLPVIDIPGKQYGDLLE